MVSAERKRVWAWAFYDWGNSAFATTVMAGFFPVFFKQYWSTGVDASVSTAKLGVANSLASVIVALLSPLLGAIADRGGHKKRLLATFSVLGVVMTGGLFRVAQGDWASAVALYVAATVGFSGGIVFYDSLLVGVAPPAKRDRVSALGYALGYLGGGLLFGINVWMTLSPATFGLADAAEAVRVSFLMVAAWWALGCVPLLRWVPEPPGDASTVPQAVRDGVRQLVATLRRLRSLPDVWGFLIAYWLYIDGVDTIVRMAVDYGLSLGFESKNLIAALLITQLVGFPAALGWGALGARIGTRNGILICVAVYLGVTVFGYTMDSVAEFYALAAIVGLVQGGVQALSRAFYSRLIPPDEAAEFFGLYNMLGKLAAVMGPAIRAAVSVAPGRPRLSILSLMVFFVAGGALLLRVPDSSPPAHK